MLARRILTAAALALVALLADGAAPPKARCAICNTASCYSSSTCFRGCACLKTGRETLGTCVSFDAIPPGARVLE